MEIVGMMGVGLVVEVEVEEEAVVSAGEEEAMVVEICIMSQVVTMTTVNPKCLSKVVVSFLCNNSEAMLYLYPSSFFVVVLFKYHSVEDGIKTFVSWGSIK